MCKLTGDELGAGERMGSVGRGGYSNLGQMVFWALQVESFQTRLRGRTSMDVFVCTDLWYDKYCLTIHCIALRPQSASAAAGLLYMGKAGAFIF